MAKKDNEKSSIEKYIDTFRVIMALLLTTIGGIVATLWLNYKTLDELQISSAVYATIVLLFIVMFVIVKYVDFHERLENLDD